MRCTHHCLTAPSRCRGHPTGISESSSSPLPNCSITVPKSGTSMVALRLMCALLHCHVSKDNSPRAATSSRAATVGCSRSGTASSRTDSRSPCMGSRPLANPAVVARAEERNLIAGLDKSTSFFSVHRLLAFARSISTLVHGMN